MTQTQWRLMLLNFSQPYHYNTAKHNSGRIKYESITIIMLFTFQTGIIVQYTPLIRTLCYDGNKKFIRIICFYFLSFFVLFLWDGFQLTVVPSRDYYFSCQNGLHEPKHGYTNILLCK